MLLNDDMAETEKLYEICSSTFVVENFLGFLLIKSLQK